MFCAAVSTSVVVKARSDGSWDRWSFDAWRRTLSKSAALRGSSIVSAPVRDQARQRPKSKASAVMMVLTEEKVQRAVVSGRVRRCKCCPDVVGQRRKL